MAANKRRKNHNKIVLNLAGKKTNLAEVLAKN